MPCIEAINCESALVADSAISYAGFWRRLLAFFIDYLLISLFVAPVLYLFYGQNYFLWLVQSPDMFEIFGAVDLLLTKILPLALLVLFWTSLGATPGKMLLDCKIVDAHSGDLITVKKALIRLLGYFISALPFYLGFIWIARDKRKQGLHDKLAGTLVLHQPDDYAHMSLAELMAPFEKEPR